MKTVLRQSQGSIFSVFIIFIVIKTSNTSKKKKKKERGSWYFSNGGSDASLEEGQFNIIGRVIATARIQSSQMSEAA